MRPCFIPSIFEPGDTHAKSGKLLHQTLDQGTLVEVRLCLLQFSVLDYSFKMKDKARLMTTTPIIEIDDEIISVNPQLLFQRLLATVERDDEADFNEIFQYELSTTPAALFSEKDGLMRKADKSKLSEAVWKFSGESASTLPDKVAYVLDGVP